jgi:hypothetical protein
VLSEDGQIRAGGQELSTTADVTAGIMTLLAELAGNPEGARGAIWLVSALVIEQSPDRHSTT